MSVSAPKKSSVPTPHSFCEDQVLEGVWGSDCPWLGLPFLMGLRKKWHKGLKLKPGLGEWGWGGEALIAESYFSSKCSHLSEPWKSIRLRKTTVPLYTVPKKKLGDQGQIIFGFGFCRKWCSSNHKYLPTKGAIPTAFQDQVLWS